MISLSTILLLLVLLVAATTAASFVLYHPSVQSCLQTCVSKCYCKCCCCLILSKTTEDGGKLYDDGNSNGSEKNALLSGKDDENEQQYYCSSLIEDEGTEKEMDCFIAATKEALLMLGDDDTLADIRGGCTDGVGGISENLRRLLLYDFDSDIQSSASLSNERNDEEQGLVSNGHGNVGSSTDSMILEQKRKRRIIMHKKEEERIKEKELVFKGVPRPPFYREVAIRLYLLTKYYCLRRHGNRWWQWRPWKKQQQQQQSSYLVNATTLGMKEYETAQLPLLPTTMMPTAQHLVLWLRNAGDNGILHLLGMRRTVGTTNDCLLPPDWNVLLKAANQPHKRPSPPSSSSSSSSSKGKHKMLTVAARARTKHAHRGRTDLYFGSIRGSASDQNVVTEQILIDMLYDAVWVNIHVFSGQVHPVLEIRVSEGYGARWMIMVDEKDKGDVMTITDEKANEAKTVFRGFLEPQMEDGHEKKWRH